MSSRGSAIWLGWTSISGMDPKSQWFLRIALFWSFTSFLHLCSWRSFKGDTTAFEVEDLEEDDGVWSELFLDSIFLAILFEVLGRVVYTKAYPGLNGSHFPSERTKDTKIFSQKTSGNKSTVWEFEELFPSFLGICIWYRSGLFVAEKESKIFW